MLWRIVSRLFQMTPVTIELKTKSMRFSVNFSKSSRICQYLIWIPRPFSGSSSIPSFLITLRIFHKSFAGTFSFFQIFISFIEVIPKRKKISSNNVNNARSFSVSFLGENLEEKNCPFNFRLKIDAAFMVILQTAFLLPNRTYFWQRIREISLGNGKM